MPKTSTLARLKEATCAEFGLSLSDIMFPTKARVISRPRQVVMYLAKERYSRHDGRPYSNKECVNFFHMKDHTSCVHGSKKVAELLADPALADRVQRVQARVDDPSWVYVAELVSRGVPDCVVKAVPEKPYQLPPIETRLPPWPDDYLISKQIVEAIANKPKFDPLWSNVKPIN